MIQAVRKGVVSPWVWVLFVSLQIPALRTVDKYVDGAPLLFVPLLLAGAFASYAALIHPSESLRDRIRILDTPWPTLVLWALYTLAAMVVYPIADGLKLQGRGSDQDDAIQLGAANVLQGMNPYAADTYFGNPISPGPGWILLWTPLVALGAYWLITPISLAIATWSLKLSAGSWRTVNLFMLFMGSSMIFWELMVVGSDLIALGCLLVASVAAVHRAARVPVVVLLAVLIGALATSRVVFFYLPFVFGLMLWNTSRRHAVTISLLGCGVCFGLHAWFWALQPEAYAPLHLLTKGDRILSRFVQVVALLACGGSAFIMLQLMKGGLRDWTVMLWLSLATPLLFVTVGDLVVVRGGDMATWEGANYLVPPLALVASFVALQASARED